MSAHKFSSLAELSRPQQYAYFAASAVATEFLNQITQRSDPDRFSRFELEEAADLQTLYASTALNQTVFACQEDMPISVLNAQSLAKRFTRLGNPAGYVLPDFLALEAEARAVPLDNASLDRLDAAYSHNGAYVGKVARIGEFDIDLRVGETQTINCNKVHLSRVPVVGEDVLIRYKEGKGSVDAVRRIQPHAVLHRSFVGEVVAHGHGVLVQDVGRNSLVTHETQHLHGEASIGSRVRIAYDGRGRPSMEQRSRAQAELSR